MGQDLILPDASPWARETWWSGRRRRYNIGLLVAGFLAFICYALTVETCIAFHTPGDWEITILTIAFQAFAYLAMLGVANLCYLLGPWSERVLQPHNVAAYRTVAFRLGFWFSLLLPFAPSVVLFVSCSIHRGEDKRIILELIKRVTCG